MKPHSCESLKDAVRTEDACRLSAAKISHLQLKLRSTTNKESSRTKRAAEQEVKREL